MPNPVSSTKRCRSTSTPGAELSMPSWLNSGAYQVRASTESSPLSAVAISEAASRFAFILQ